MWHLHISIIAMFVQLHSFLWYRYISARHLNVAGLVNPRCGKCISVSSAGGERGAPPTVVGHTLMGSAVNSNLTTGVVKVADMWVFVRATIGVLTRKSALILRNNSNLTTEVC